MDKGIDFIDYSPCFINSTEADRVIKAYFIKGDIHWNEEGHKVIFKKWMEIKRE